ncbi:MAG TPA: hypothetical protein PLB89_02705 [Flavobacteriales bacterium]|nr:hypothetical protein [Flavobacteriales bacterium]
MKYQGLIDQMLVALMLAMFSTEAIAQQSYQSGRLKEAFDYRNREKMYVQWHDLLVPWQEYDDDTYGDGISYTLEAYVSMFEATRDKAYLYKFVVESLRALRDRHDYAQLYGGNPYWAEPTTLHYLNGNMAGALAKFVHYVKEVRPELGSLPLNASLLDLTGTPYAVCQNEPGFGGCDTFGEYAHWLGYRVDRTIDQMIEDDWIPGEGLRYNVGDEFPTAINLQAGFTKAVLLNGLANVLGPEGSTWYTSKANTIASKCKSLVTIENNCQNADYLDYALKPSPDNTTWWYHAGWRVKTTACGLAQRGDYDSFVEFKDDISHGATVSLMLDELHRYGTEQHIVDNDMVRLHNMFTKRLYRPSSNSFAKALDGSDEPISPSSVPPNIALAYAHLIPFDNFDASSIDDPLIKDSVYEILMDLFLSSDIDHPYSQGFSLDDYTGLHMRGHADLVGAQWKKECVDLTLFNRDVRYDQDFFVKHVLTIKPEGGSGTSFADPIIYDPYFIIRSGIRSEARAGAAVVLERGFQTEPNSVFHAYIDPAGCALDPDGSSASQLALLPVRHETELSIPTEEKIAKAPSQSLKVAVIHGARNVRLNVATSTPGLAYFTLLDRMGAVVQQPFAANLVIGSQDFTMPLPDLAAGLYLLQSNVGGQVQCTRIFIDQQGGY